ncbi:flavodoxin [Candidatus Acetothermia bacterium]|jgi:flavodoxin I|nr:flavodoxin [Candidatus Acetothermia bacterium]MCI2426868.1 flavodoxin [Candidatus Acetothermia bacterium]MCI2427956.1 flavodoxin [Candidatus Acetothermia bacterium]
MRTAIVVFGSTTGNTERLAGSVAEGLKEGAVKVTVKNVTQTKVEELGAYDCIILGSSTWGLGELQDDFVPFYEKLANVTLNGKKAAVFGTGDENTFPDNFCEAVDILAERLVKCGAVMITDKLKVQTDMGAGVDEQAEEGVKAWALTLAKSL